MKTFLFTMGGKKTKDFLKIKLKKNYIKIFLKIELKELTFIL